MRVLLTMPDERHVRKASGAGLDVWCVADPALYPAFGLSRLADCARGVLAVDSADDESVRTVIGRAVDRYAISHLLLLGSPGRGAAAVQAAALGLSPNPVEAVRILDDPVLLARLLLRNGRAGPRLWPVPESPPGPVVSALTVTVNGMHHTVALVAERAAEESLAAGRACAAVRAVVCGLLDLVRYESGLVRTDLVLAVGGPCVLRARAWPDPAGIESLVQAVTGDDPETDYLRALSGQDYRPPPVHRITVPDLAAGRLEAGTLVPR
jgi:hypothetical protein